MKKYPIRKIWNLFIYIKFQTGQTIQLQGGQQVKEPNRSLENFIHVMLLSGHFSSTWSFSGVHPTTGLTSHHHIPIFQCHIQCTNIKNIKGNTRKNQTDPDLVLNLGELILNCVAQAAEYAEKKIISDERRLWPWIMIKFVFWYKFNTRIGQFSFNY